MGVVTDPRFRASYMELRFLASVASSQWCCRTLGSSMALDLCEDKPGKSSGQKMNGA